MIARFLFGLTAPLKAFKLIFSQPKLWMLSLIPVLIAIAVFAFVLMGWWSWWVPLLQTWTAGLAGWADFVVNLGALGSVLIIALVFLYALPIVIGLIASPLHFYLSHLTEKIILKETVGEGKFSLRIFFEDVKISVLTLILGAFAWLVGLIPLAGLLTAPLMWILLAFDFLYYPLAKRQMGLSQCLDWLRKNLPEALGFGLALTIGFSIPGLNLLLIPGAVVAGTLIFCEQKN